LAHQRKPTGKTAFPDRQSSRRKGSTARRSESDTRLRARAEDRLHGQPYHALHQVVCEVEAGTLILSGRLPSWYLKQRAQEAVAGLEGVRRVDNRIEVIRLRLPR
jgi:osmotically-inducible protein OsmY